MTTPVRPTYSCLGKETFADKGRADEVAHRHARRSKNKVSTYRCDYCHAWHIGSRIVPKSRRSSISKKGART